MVVALAGVLLLAACGEGSPDEGSTAAATEKPRPAAAVDPVDLVGMWRLVGAQGERPDAVLRLAPDDLVLWRTCGVLMGTWRATGDGLFLAYLFGAAEGCAADTPTPPWLRDAVRFGTSGDDRVLLDAADQVVARLLPGGRPAASAGTSPYFTEAPTVTQDKRRVFLSPAPLPPTLRPATLDRLLGRWLPATGAASTSPDQPHAAFRGDGSWTGSDGCNRQSGRWVIGPGGAFLALMGPHTMIGCDNVSVGSWLWDVRRVGFHGDVLVLLDAAGAEVGRLERAVVR